MASIGTAGPSGSEGQDSRHSSHGNDILAPARPRLPAAAARGVSNLFLLTLLSGVDGSLVALAAAGHLDSPASAAIVGLVIVAGAGSWLAAQQGFGNRRRTGTDWLLLAGLGIATTLSTVASVWLGGQLGSALTLHVLPKGAGVILFLVSIEVAGLRLPRAGRVPLPVAGLLAIAILEVATQWAA